MVSQKIPSVSAIIPVYNRPELFQKAVQSILSQSYQDFEIIVVDDASTPCIKYVFDDRRVRLIRRDKNGGTGTARNTGIQAARGRYIAFLDSDDIWLPGKLLHQIPFLEKHPEGQAAITGYNLKMPGLAERSVLPPQPRSWLRHLIMGSSLGAGSTLLVRRECFAEIGFFDEQLSHYEDLDWLLEYSKKYSLIALREPLARVEKQGRASAEEIERSAHYFVKKHKTDFEQFGFYGSRALGKRWLIVATYYFAEGNKSKGSEYLLKTLKQNPFQRPGMYLRIIDSLLGTSLHQKISGFLTRRAKE